MSVLASLALLLGSNVSFSAVQPGDKVKWTVSRVLPARGDTQFVQIGAQIDAGWHVYSLTQQPDGPFPLRVTGAPAADGRARWAVAGPISGPEPERLPTSPFGIPVAGAGTGGRTVVLRVRYQACSDTLCLPPKTIELSTRIAAR